MSDHSPETLRPGPTRGFRKACHPRGRCRRPSRHPSRGSRLHPRRSKRSPGGIRETDRLACSARGPRAGSRSGRVFLPEKAQNWKASSRTPCRRTRPGGLRGRFGCRSREPGHDSVSHDERQSSPLGVHLRRADKSRLACDRRQVAGSPRTPTSRDRTGRGRSRSSRSCRQSLRRMQTRQGGRIPTERGADARGCDVGIPCTSARPFFAPVRSRYPVSRD